MAESIQEIFKRKLVPVRFERTMGLLGATTLGIGALMGAGIYVLIGLAAEKAGPAVWLSYLICGLLSLLSVYVFGELSRRVPIAGGGYAFAYNALGSFWGFITGWMLALGSIVSDELYHRAVPMVILEEEDFLTIKQGDYLVLKPDGTVLVNSKRGS